MSQKIFQLGLSVEAVSLYLLCVSLTEMPKPLTTDNIKEIWNGTDKQLGQALLDLETRNIVQNALSDASGRPVYQLTDEDNWA
jgi:hypothetical protein